MSIFVRLSNRLCPSVRPSVCKLLFKWRATPFPMRDNYEIAKIHWRVLKIFLSRTTGPISSKLRTNHPWDSNSFKWRAMPFSKGDNYEKGNILWRNFLLQNYWANFMIYTGIIIALLICFYWGERCGPWASCKHYVSQVLRVSLGMGMSVGEVKDSF